MDLLVSVVHTYPSFTHRLLRYNPDDHTTLMELLSNFPS